MDVVSRTTHSILAVDDNEQIRELLSIIIGNMGYRYVTAVDGLDALEKLEKDTFDLVITDIDMPRLNGIELIKRIVSDFDAVEVIAITGSRDRYGSADIVALGAIDLIYKPFDLDGITAKINQVIDGRSSQHKALNVNSYGSARQINITSF